MKIYIIENIKWVCFIEYKYADNDYGIIIWSCNSQEDQQLTCSDALCLMTAPHLICLCMKTHLRLTSFQFTGCFTNSHVEFSSTPFPYLSFSEVRPILPRLKSLEFANIF